MQKNMCKRYFFNITRNLINLVKNYNKLKRTKDKKTPNINIYLATNKSIFLTFASKTFIKHLNY